MIGTAKSVARGLFRATVAFPATRRLLNILYLNLSPYQRSLFHRRFAKIFRNAGVQGRDGYWKVTFAQKQILMPLRAGNFWLDWDNAVSIVGHDIEIIETYESIIQSGSAPPELFIDIGANYGTHSLLFLVHGIETMTFEPNSACHACFERMCKLNHVSPNLEPVALGDRPGYAELSYPKRDTWLGSTNKDVIDRLLGSNELVSERVEQRTLDDYSGKIGSKRTLIKIDTEGNELSVLKGARRILDESRPRVIFESFSGEQKIGIFKLFAAADYSIYPLPWDPKHEAGVLDERQFMASSETNFIAVPGGPG